MDKFKELSFEEMVEVDGGIWPVVIWGAQLVVGAFIGGAIVEIVTEGWDQCVADYQSGYNEVKR
jgi:lactobin A/cerein 7B family class IIb bacteriocin